MEETLIITKCSPQLYYYNEGHIPNSNGGEESVPLGAPCRELRPLRKSHVGHQRALNWACACELLPAPAQVSPGVTLGLSQVPTKNL